MASEYQRNSERRGRSGMSGAEKPAEEGRRQFATTRWSLVLAAGESHSERSERALAELCSQYWYPLYAYTRRRGYDPDDARDLTQAFFAKLLEKRDLRVADSRRGRFRTFLLSSLKNFLAGERRKEHSLKRGGEIKVLSLDFDSAEENYRAEPSHELSPEAIYERRWAFGLLERAVSDLHSQYKKAGNLDLFDALKEFLGGEEDVLPYSELSKRLGQSEGALRTAVSRLRARWRKRLRELVAETVNEEREIHDELNTLIASVDSRV
jgi:RNA polymerase sigma factor (sigma-70 family)